MSSRRSLPVRSEQGSPSPLPRSQRSGPTTSTFSSAAPASARGSTSSARGKVQHHLHAQSLVAGSSDDAPDGAAVAVDEDDDDESSTSTVILSLLTRGAQLGAAVYNEATGKLLLLEDSMIKGARLGLQQDLTGRLLTPVVDGEERAAPWDLQQEDALEKVGDLVTMLLEQFKPDTILVGSQCSDATKKTVQRHSAMVGGRLWVRPSKEFDTAAGKMKLGPRLKGSPDTPLSLAAAAALLDNLVRLSSIRSNASDMAEDLTGERVPHAKIQTVDTICLDGCMTLNADTREALAISHHSSSGYAGKDDHKGLTLFALLNNTRTLLSPGLMRQWFLFPSTDLAILAERHDAIECFKAPSNTATADSIIQQLKGIKNVPKLVDSLLAGHASLTQWKNIVSFCLQALHIRELASQLEQVTEQPVPIIERCLEEFDPPSLQGIAESIEATIDWDQSAIEGRACVQAGINAQLDEWREIYTGLPDLLINVAKKLKTQYTFEQAGLINVAYFPQLGYLVALRFTDSLTLPAHFQVPPGWEFHFASSSSAYYKTVEMTDLDSHLGDVHSFIADREIEVMHELTASVAAAGGLLVKVAETCAEMDCLLAFAKASEIYNYVRPRMMDDARLEVKGGRHPLQELCVDSYQANDILLAGGGSAEEGAAPTMQILTGANGCGKSVYLKQVGLIVFMAQIGCFVPAESATIGVVDQILTRIHARETIATRQSSFLTDVSQVSHALRSATPRSLVLLDEFGKGTKACDGAALFAATGRHLLLPTEDGEGPGRPRCVATTHFHEVLNETILPLSLGYQPCSMEIAIHRPDSKDTTSRPHGDAAAATAAAAASTSRGSISSAASNMSGSHTSTTNTSTTTPPSPSPLTFLFRLQPGISSSDSHAIYCAALSGVPEEPVLRRARYVTKVAVLKRDVARLQLESLVAVPSAAAAAAQRAGGEEGQGGEEESGLSAEQRAKRAEAVLRRFVEWDLGKERERVGKRRRQGEGGGDDDGSVAEKLAKILGETTLNDRAAGQGEGAGEKDGDGDEVMRG